MTARCTNFTGERATIVFEPGWLSMLLGARPVSLDLEYVDSHREWRTVATRRWITDLTEVEDIRRALDFRDLGTPSRAIVVEDDEAVAP